MAITKLAFMPDTVGNNSFLRNPPGYVVNLVLGPTPKSWETPASTATVIFSANGPFWVNASASANVPSASVTDGTGSELSPMGYQVSAGVRLSFAALRETLLSIAVYS